MGTYTQLLYQIVYSTKHREATLDKPHRNDLFKDLWGILRRKNCYPYQIGGVEDHIHIITHIHPSLAISDLVKDLKLGSSSFISNAGIFPDFGGWQDGYGVFSYSINAKKNLIDYVKNQEVHHRTVSFLEEFKALLKEHEIEFDERFLV